MYIDTVIKIYDNNLKFISFKKVIISFIRNLYMARKTQLGNCKNIVHTHKNILRKNKNDTD